MINGDKVIWVLVIILSAISLLAIYSSTSSLAWREQNGNTEYYLIRQFIFVVLGLLIMFLVHRMNYIYFSRAAQFLFYASIVLLIATLLFGPVINGARRYLLINIPGLGMITFQTSDMAKLALMMYLARFLAKNQDEIRNFKNGFIKIIIPILVICGLILPSNFSTAAMLFVASLGILYIGRASIKHIMALIGIGALGFIMLLMIAKFQPWQRGNRDKPGSRIAIVFNGSPRFTGDAGSGDGGSGRHEKIRQTQSNGGRKTKYWLGCYTRQGCKYKPPINRAHH